jgi:antirestriction protein
MKHQPCSTEQPLRPPAELPPAATGQPEAASESRPRIWVTSLADYNHGTVHGVWLNAARDEADLQADIDTMLAASPLTAETGELATEWAIHDYTGFGDLRIDQRENLNWISLVATGIAEHGLAFAAYADVVEEEELLASFDADFLGHYDSLHAYLEQRVNDLGYDRILDEVVPASIRPYVKIDIAATANDLLRGGDLHTVPAPDGGVWIFNG